MLSARAFVVRGSVECVNKILLQARGEIVYAVISKTSEENGVLIHELVTDLCLQPFSVR
jgi:hypothetical protein